ncbi:glycoside hydrolase N-terminal domain-containing protein, partial [Pontiella sp.]
MRTEKLAVASAALALAAGASAIVKPLPVPERGFISSKPGETWEQGLLSGNGTVGLNVFGQPLDETAILTHERMFIPLGKPHMPPDNGNRLFEIRNLIDRGLYRQATELALELSGQEGFLYHDHFVPTFDLKIKMDAKGEAKDYMRSVDFQTGVATVQWSDDNGTYERRSFVSRADGLAVMQIEGSAKGSVGCRLKMKVRDPHPELIGGGNSPQKPRSDNMYKFYVEKTTFAAEADALTVRQTFNHSYPGSIHAMEGIVQVVNDGGTVTKDGDELVVKGADRVLLLIDVEMLYDPAHTAMGTF